MEKLEHKHEILAKYWWLYKKKKKKLSGTNWTELYNMPAINITFVILNWKMAVLQQRLVGSEWTEIDTDVLSEQIKRGWARAHCC